MKSFQSVEIESLDFESDGVEDFSYEMNDDSVDDELSALLEIVNSDSFSDCVEGFFKNQSAIINEALTSDEIGFSHQTYQAFIAYKKMIECMLKTSMPHGWDPEKFASELQGRSGPLVEEITDVLSSFADFEGFLNEIKIRSNSVILQDLALGIPDN